MILRQKKVNELQKNSPKMNYFKKTVPYKTMKCPLGASVVCWKWLKRAMN